jgi:pimeloyl-ACP methyl ester carboxylesterase
MSESIKPYTFSAESDGESIDYVKLKDDRQIAYKRHGYGKHTIVDFHGNPGSRLNPTPRNMHLHLLDVNVVLFDRPGYGKSDRNESRQIIDTAYDVEQILDALHVERFGLIARSGGVPHALGTAALLGDRATGMFCASGLAPRETNPAWDAMTTDNQEKHRLARQDRALLALNLATHAARVQYDPAALYDHIFPDFSVPDHEMLEDDSVIRPLIINSHAEGMGLNAFGWLDDTLALNSEAGWGFDLADISCPTVFWHGMQDTFSHYSQSETLRDLVPGSASVIHPSLGHFGSIAQTSNALSYVRDCGVRSTEDDQSFQWKAEDLEYHFQIHRMYDTPLRPTVVMHGLGQ